MTTKNSKRDSSRAPVPHSWDFQAWPQDVWPGKSGRARWIAKAYRSELINAGALSRAGKILIFRGAGYTKWLDQRAANVADFTSNNPALRQPTADAK